ncbi:MAG: hypothetical protein HQ538_00820 [Parcubacteria group bacterium]|nr:hypothetical protein [Parcubacteria group bacterium]
MSPNLKSDKKKSDKKNIFETLFSPKIKSKKTISTQKFLNIAGIRDGVAVLKSGGLRSILLASSINFALMSEDEQSGKIYAFQDFLNSLEFPIQIIAQTRKLNIIKYVDKIKEAGRMQENELLRMQIAGYGEYIVSLVELANITTNNFYVVVPYTPSPGQGVKSPIDKIKGFMRPAVETKAKTEAFEKSKEELHLRVSHVVGGLSGMGIRSAALDTQEIVELLYSWYNPEVSSNEVLADLKDLKIERGEQI